MGGFYLFIIKITQPNAYSKNKEKPNNTTKEIVCTQLQKNIKEVSKTILCKIY